MPRLTTNQEAQVRIVAHALKCSMAHKLLGLTHTHSPLKQRGSGCGLHMDSWRCLSACLTHTHTHTHTHTPARTHTRTHACRHTESIEAEEQ